MMKNLVKLFVVMMLAATVSAQVDVSAGMGINFINSSSLKDYVNANFQGTEKMNSFNTGVEFFAEADYTLSPSFQMGVEYAMEIFSYNSDFSGGLANYDISYTHHKPSVLAYYVLPGEGYKFKFGGGVGLRYVSVDEEIFQTRNYSSTGFGLLLRAQGHTALGGNFYANIGADMRLDMPGEPENDGTPLGQNTGGDVNLNSFSVGVKLGVSYFF